MLHRTVVTVLSRVDESTRSLCDPARVYPCVEVNTCIYAVSLLFPDDVLRKCEPGILWRKRKR